MWWDFSGDIDAKAMQGKIKFSTASGDVDLSDISGDSKVSTASGRIKANNVEGKIKLSTASGNADVSNSSGEFEVGTASGDVDATAIVFKGKSSFGAASGDLDVTLGKSLEFDLKLSTASGNAILNFDSHPIKGYIEMTAKAKRGRIKAPFKFDDEEYYYKWDDEYVTKSVTKGSDRPSIIISTASGKAVLLED